jgi:hypothetical protein
MNTAVANEMFAFAGENKRHHIGKYKVCRKMQGNSGRDYAKNSSSRSELSKTVDLSGSASLFRQPGAWMSIRKPGGVLWELFKILFDKKLRPLPTILGRLGWIFATPAVRSKLKTVFWNGIVDSRIPPVTTAWHHSRGLGWGYCSISAVHAVATCGRGRDSMSGALYPNSIAPSGILLAWFAR